MDNTEGPLFASLHNLADYLIEKNDIQGLTHFREVIKQVHSYNNEVLGIVTRMGNAVEDFTA